MAWKLDRLGRDLRHLVNTVGDLTKRGIGLKVLAGEGASIDTTTANGRLIFAIFAGLAEFERDITQFRVWFDTSGVLCLSEDKIALWAALQVACGGPFMTPNEARKNAGFKPIEGGEKLQSR